MNLPEYAIFLGFSIDSNTFDSIDPALKEIYIKEGEDYLLKITYGQTLYLGKWVGKTGEIAKLRLLEENICSLLAKLLPKETIQKTPLQLIALEPQESRLCS